ncbi:MAG: hypothetical protein E7352_03495 [Clostridiales bacterium]|nr:hypothetical protein [Clostridiales bacterium]
MQKSSFMGRKASKEGTYRKEKGRIMNYSVFDGKKLLINLARFALYMALILVTPYLAGFTSPWFIQISYNQLTPFFVKVVLTLLWLMEIGIIVLVERLIKRKKAKQQAGEQVAIKEPKSKKEKKEISVLPLKNVLIIVGIILACLVVVGLQIGLEVKPFYDMAQRVTSAYDYLNNVGPIILAVAKCLWTVLIIKVALGMGEAVFGVLESKAWKAILTWGFATILLFSFGLYDIVSSESKYAWTYVLFYLLFPLLYWLTKKSDGKFYLIILFIYIF